VSSDEASLPDLFASLAPMLLAQQTTGKNNTAVQSLTAVTTRKVKLRKIALKFFNQPAKWVIGI